VTAALLCALVTASSAAAEEGDSAPIRPVSEGGFSFPEITGPTSPEEYPFHVRLGSEQSLEQVSATLVEVVYPGHEPAFSIVAEAAHDADGATVPTTLSVSGPEIVTLTVHYRAGNPAAGGAPFVYPITGGFGWEGGFHTLVVDIDNQPPEEPPAPAFCTVPSLHALTLHAARSRLRVADCSLGQVRLARGATKGKGKVVRQFHPAGTDLAAGAPVGVKLGPAS